MLFLTVMILQHFVCVCVCVCVSVVTEPALIRSPVNTAVIRGSTVTLSCASNAGNAVIKWYNRLCDAYDSSNDCERRSVIYNGYTDDHNPPRFSVTAVKNSTLVTRDLNISPTQLTDAGVYVCVENIPGEHLQHTHSAQFVVVGIYL